MSQATSNLTKGPVKKHLFALTIPAAMGMMFDTLYNLTDNFFAGMISNHALAGLSIAGLIFSLLIAITLGLQSGTSAMVAPDFANQDMKKTQRWISNCIGVALVLGVMILVWSFRYTDNLMSLLSDDQTAKTEAWLYLKVIILGNFPYAINCVCAGALIAMGHIVIYRNVLIVSFFVNIILNPLCAFQFNLGIAGLAISTVIIKCCAACYLFATLKKHIGVFPWPRYNRGHWFQCLKQIIPSSFNFMTIIIGTFFIVAFVGRFGIEAVAGYSVAVRIEQVLLLPALGLSSAVMAIVGQNFGVAAHHRVRETYQTALKIGLLVSLLFMLIMMFGGPLLMSFFTNDEQIVAIGSQYLRADAIAFYAYVVLFISVAALQAIKQPNFPLIIGILRQLVLPISVNYLLIVRYGYPLGYLFWSIVAIVLLSAVIMYFYTYRQLKHLARIQ